MALHPNNKEELRERRAVMRTIRDAMIASGIAQGITVGAIVDSPDGAIVHFRVTNLELVGAPRRCYLSSGTGLYVLSE